MIGILLIAHAPLASALSEAARHVYSRNARGGGGRVLTLDVAPDAEPDAIERDARAVLGRLDDGHGVLVLTDCLGGTPANVAARLAQAGRVEVVAGANLPMLLRALCYCEGPLAELAEKAIAGGTRGVASIARPPVPDRQGCGPDDDFARIQDQQ